MIRLFEQVGLGLLVCVLALATGACQVAMDPADHQGDGTASVVLPEWGVEIVDLPEIEIAPAIPDGPSVTAEPGGLTFAPDMPSTPDTPSTPDAPLRTALDADPDAPPAAAGLAPIHESGPDVGPAAPTEITLPPRETRLLSERFGTPPQVQPKTVPVLEGVPVSTAELGELPGLEVIDVRAPVVPDVRPAEVSLSTDGPTDAPTGNLPVLPPSQSTPSQPTPSQPTPTADHDVGDVGLEMPAPSAFPRLPGEPEPAVVDPPAPSGFPAPEAPDAATGGMSEPQPVDPTDPWSESADGATATGSPDGAVGPDVASGSPDGGMTTPPAPPAPTAADDEGDPWSSAPDEKSPPAADDEDPWGRPPDGGESKDPSGFTDLGGSSTERIQAHVTRLRDRPGDPAIEGYPTALLDRADASVAVKVGARPCVVIFYDDAARGSDLTAATLLPVLARHAKRIDLVLVDRGLRAPAGPVFDALARRYLNGVPTVAVLPADRTSPDLFWRDIGAAQVDAAITTALRAPASPKPGAGDNQGPGERVDPSEDEGLTPEPSPLVGTLRDHVQRLRDRAGDPALAGYPTTLVRSVNPKVVLEPGSKPVVIMFYDNSKKASDLQAAEFLPVLARHTDDIDLVLIDVRFAKRWNAVERKVVLTYFMAFTPTTVVLTARRAPVKLWYHRISGPSLERAIQDAKKKR